MKMLILIFTILTAAPALAVPLDFEVGGENADSLNAVSPNYGGLSWDSRWQLVDTATYQGVFGNTHAFPSGNQALYNGFGTEALTISGLTMTGAWFAPWTAYNEWYTPYSSTSVTVEGYLGSTFVGSMTLLLDPTQFLFVNTNFGGPTDTVKILSSMAGAQWYLMDDLTFTQPPPPVTPVIVSVDGPATTVP